ncbi:hypothetical protein HPP92_013679 [Vanilla planifolia]|uniref:Uncharacterized protein n=1 Tax=Vanilla planifolia TaxID=51239 RepID=A0A835QYQ0_VANPL|nr:hypothetical protein HPP92_013679 [Vanilla planifolia]
MRCCAFGPRLASPHGARGRWHLGRLRPSLPGEWGDQPPKLYHLLRPSGPQANPRPLSTFEEGELKPHGPCSVPGPGTPPVPLLVQRGGDGVEAGRRSRLLPLSPRISGPWMVLTGDNESRSTSSFSGDPPFLEVLSRKKRKKKRWSSTRAADPWPPELLSSVPLPPNDQFGVECRGWRIMPPSEDSSSSPPSPPTFLLHWNHSLAMTKSHPSAVSLGSWTGYAPAMEKFGFFGESIMRFDPPNPLAQAILCHLYSRGMPPSFFSFVGQHSRPLVTSGRTSWLTLRSDLLICGGDFQQLIDCKGLLIPPVSGSNFTWQGKRNGKVILKRLDYFLCNSRWLDLCRTRTSTSSP